LRVISLCLNETIDKKNETIHCGHETFILFPTFMEETMADQSGEETPKRLYYVRVDFSIFESGESVCTGSSYAFAATTTREDARQQAALACYSDLISDDIAVQMKVIFAIEMSAEQVAILQTNFAHARPQAEIDALKWVETDGPGDD